MLWRRFYQWRINRCFGTSIDYASLSREKEENDIAASSPITAGPYQSAAEKAARQDIVRVDWKKSEIAEIYRSPLLELIYYGVGGEIEGKVVIMISLFGFCLNRTHWRMIN
jgi:hypothetical protein